MKKIQNSLSLDELHYYIFDLRVFDYRKTIQKIINFYGESITLNKNKNGKPFLQGSKINISISHSNIFAIIVLSLNKKIGVDIEKRFAIDGLDVISLLSKREYFLIKELQAECFQESFFDLWCLKESYFKAMGSFSDISDIYNKKTKSIVYTKISVPENTCIILHGSAVKKIVDFSHMIGL